MQTPTGPLLSLLPFDSSRSLVLRLQMLIDTRTYGLPYIPTELIRKQPKHGDAAEDRKKKD